MDQQSILQHLLQQIQQAQQIQQLQQFSQQQQPAHLLLQPTALQQLQYLQQQRNLLFQVPLPSHTSITEVPETSPSPSSFIPSSATSSLIPLSTATSSDGTQSSCASNVTHISPTPDPCIPDTASVETSSGTKCIEVNSISLVKAALSAKESCNESDVKAESKSLKSAASDFHFTISSDSEDVDDDLDTDFEPKKRKANSKEIDDSKKKSVKVSGNASASSDKPKSKAGRPKNSKNKGEKKSTLIKKLESLESSSVSVINADNLPETTSRLLRSNGRCEPEPGSSSNLKSVNIGFDFSPKKLIDPEMLEKIEACIVKSQTSWDDVVGLDNVKQRLREAAVLPIIRPDLFVGFRAASKGVLLYGPPGTGKTMLAKCAASASNCTFISVRSSDIMSKWIGDAEKAVAALFEVARRKQPSIIFIDEVDSLLSTRKQGEHDSIRRIKTELLTQWDGLSSEENVRIMVLGATNRPMDLDLAALRRFGQHLYVPLPDTQARKAMFRMFAKSEDVKVKLSETDIIMLGLNTSNYSAADIANVLKDACMAPIRDLTFAEVEKVSVDQLRPVCRQDLENSLSTMKPTCNSEALYDLENWNQRSE